MKCDKPFLFLVTLLAASACKSNSGIDSSPVVTESTGKKTTITLHDQPLATIQKYVVGPKWQMVYSIGGMTGKEKNEFTNTFITFSANKITHESEGKTTERAYTWVKSRNIFTGDSTYVITGLGQWKVEGIDNDTLRLIDNYPDGYGYAFIPVK